MTLQFPECSEGSPEERLARSTGATREPDRHEIMVLYKHCAQWYSGIRLYRYSFRIPILVDLSNLSRPIPTIPNSEKG